MSKLVHGLVHVVAAGLQYANLASGVVSSKYQPLVAAAIALAQAGVALYQDKYGKA